MIKDSLTKYAAPNEKTFLTREGMRVFKYQVQNLKNLTNFCAIKLLAKLQLKLLQWIQINFFITHTKKKTIINERT